MRPSPPTGSYRAGPPTARRLPESCRSGHRARMNGRRSRAFDEPPMGKRDCDPVASRQKLTRGLSLLLRRGGRAVEGGGLENDGGRCTGMLGLASLLFGFTTSVIPARPSLSRAGYTQRSCRRRWAIQRSPSRWMSTRMSYRACKEMLRYRWELRSSGKSRKTAQLDGPSLEPRSW